MQNVKITEKQLDAIRSNIAQAKRNRDSFKGRYRANLNYYRGIQDLTTNDRTDHHVVVNRILPNLEIKVESIAANDPEFNIEARNSSNDMEAKIAKAALEFHWKKYCYQQQLREAFYDACIVGYGVVYTGWRFQTKDEIFENQRKPVENEVVPPDMATEMAFEDTVDPFSPIDEDDVIEDFPDVRRISPLNFMIDPWCGSNLQRSRYAVHREIVPVDEVKMCQSYSNTDSVNGKSYLTDETPNDIFASPTGSPQIQYTEETQYAILYHYYDYKQRILVTFSEDNWDTPLRIVNWHFPYYPFAIITTHHVPDTAISNMPSDVDLVRSLQDACNNVRTRTLTHIGQFIEKFQCRKGVVGEAAKNNLRSNVKGVVVEHNGQMPEEIVPLRAPQIPTEIYQVEQRSIEDINYILGVNDLDRNMLPPGRRSATEIAELQRAGGSRANSSVYEFEKFVVEVAKRVLDLLQEFAYHTIQIPIYDEWTDTTNFVAINKENISGDYDIDIEIGSTQADNKDKQQQMAVQLLQVLTPYAQMPDPMTGQPVINLVPLLRSIVKYSGLPNWSEIMPQPQPSPPISAQPVGPQQGMVPGSQTAPGGPSDIMSQLTQMLGGQNGQMPSPQQGQYYGR